MLLLVSPRAESWLCIKLLRIGRYGFEQSSFLDERECLDSRLICGGTIWISLHHQTLKYLKVPTLTFVILSDQAKPHVWFSFTQTATKLAPPPSPPPPPHHAIFKQTSLRNISLTSLSLATTLPTQLTVYQTHNDDCPRRSRYPPPLRPSPPSHPPKFTQTHLTPPN